MNIGDYKKAAAAFVGRHGIKIWAGLAVYGNAAIMTTGLLDPGFKELVADFGAHAGGKTFMTLLAGSLAVVVFSLVARYANHDDPRRAAFEDVVRKNKKFTVARQDFDEFFANLASFPELDRDDVETFKIFLKQHCDIQEREASKLIEHTPWYEQLNPAADPIRFSANTLLPIATFYALRGLERFTEVKNILTDVWEPLLSSSMGGLSLAGLAIQKAPAGLVGGEEWRKKLSGWAFLLSSLAPVVEGVRHLAANPVTGILFISAGLSFIVANTVYLHSKITKNVPDRILNSSEKIRAVAQEAVEYGQKTSAFRPSVSSKLLPALTRNYTAA